MTNTSISPEKTLIDPRFDIPEGLETFVYPDTADDIAHTSDSPDNSTVQIFTGEPSDEESDLGDISHDGPAVPMEFTIVSQTIKVGPDGRQTVDVEIEVEDIPGVIQIDVRVTK